MTWRCILGTLFLAAAALAARTPMRLGRRVWMAAGLAGFVFAVDLWVWHRSIVLAGAGLATILGNTQVFVTAVLSAIFLGERLGWRFGAAAVSAAGGVVLLVGVGSGLDFPEGYVAGVGYGLATGLVYGIFLVLLRDAGKRHEDPTGLSIPLSFSAVAALFLIVSLRVEGATPAVPQNVESWLLVAAVALVAQGLGWWVITRSLPRVPGAIGGLLLLLQPVLATIWGLLIFNERLAALQWFGAAVTLVAVYVGSRKS